MPLYRYTGDDPRDYFSRAVGHVEPGDTRDLPDPPDGWWTAARPASATESAPPPPPRPDTPPGAPDDAQEA